MKLLLESFATLIKQLVNLISKQDDWQRNQLIWDNLLISREKNHHNPFPFSSAMHVDWQTTFTKNVGPAYKTFHNTSR